MVREPGSNGGIFKDPSNNVVGADVRAGVKIGQVFGGYFNSDGAAEAFNLMGIGAVLSSLPRRIRVADFGGGDGHLAESVREFLRSQGREARSRVVDGNPDLLRQARRRRLATSNTDMAEANLGKFDLIIMRGALHYNTPEGQRNVLSRVAASLTRNGFLLTKLPQEIPTMLHCVIR
jgi:trans-aconitate methyltransferase